MEDCSRFALHFLVIIGIYEKGQEGAVNAGRRLNDIGDVPLTTFRIIIAEVSAAVFRMLS